MNTMKCDRDRALGNSGNKRKLRPQGNYQQTEFEECLLSSSDFSPHLLYKNVQIKTRDTVTLPVALYVCQMVPQTKGTAQTEQGVEENIYMQEG